MRLSDKCGKHKALSHIHTSGTEGGVPPLLKSQYDHNHNHSYQR